MKFYLENGTGYADVGNTTLEHCLNCHGHPDNWTVETEEFDDFDSAARRAIELLFPGLQIEAKANLESYVDGLIDARAVR